MIRSVHQPNGEVNRVVYISVPFKTNGVIFLRVENQWLKVAILSLVGTGPFVPVVTEPGLKSSSGAAATNRD